MNTKGSMKLESCVSNFSKSFNFVTIAIFYELSNPYISTLLLKIVIYLIDKRNLVVLRKEKYFLLIFPVASL